MIEDIGILITMLFNLGFKNCKYCNKLFYPQHNRQVHCCPEHRKWYKQEKYNEERRKRNQQEPLISFYDGYDNKITMKPRHLKRLGGMHSMEMKCDANKKRDINFEQEGIAVRNLVRALRLR